MADLSRFGMPPPDQYQPQPQPQPAYSPGAPQSFIPAGPAPPPWADEDPFISQFVQRSATDRDWQRHYARTRSGQTGPYDPWANMGAARSRAAQMMGAMNLPWYERNRATADRYLSQALNDPLLRGYAEGIDYETGAPLGVDPYTDPEFIRASRERAAAISGARQRTMAPYYGMGG